MFFVTPSFTYAQSCDFSVAAGDSNTLISTIEQANSNAITETICLGGGTYTINDIYETGTDGTVSLPLITTSLSIEGNNSTITDTSSSDYLLELSLYLTLTVKDLTINGNRVYNNGELYYDNVQTFGGGIDSWGTIVDINNSLFDSGGTAVYYPTGTVIVNNSTFTNNMPHALYSTSPNGDIEIYDSIITNNGGGQTGGALSTRGDVIIARSTISDNYAEENGGAISVSHTISITDSVLLNNSGINDTSVTGSAVFISSGYGTVNITNNCINGNIGTAIIIGSAPQTINAENNWWGSMFTPANGEQGSGSIIGNSFIDYEPYLTQPIWGCTAPPADTINQNINLDMDTSAEVVLIMREGLTPFNFVIDTLPTNGTLTGADDTWTYTPSSGFTGYDSFAYTVTDGSNTSDSGIIYLNVGVEPIATITVDSTSQEVPLINNGNCTLGEAIQAANTNQAVDACPAGVIEFADIIDLSNSTYTFTMIDNDALTNHGDAIGANALPIVTSDIIIRGNGATLERDTNANSMRFFYAQSPYDGEIGQLTLQNMTIQNGSTTNYGGAIRSNGYVNLENVTFYNNYSDVQGGAIYGGFPSIVSSLFDSNTAQIAGGAAYLYGTSISNSVFTNNTAINLQSTGGGLHLVADTTINDTLIQNNHSSSLGGGIYVGGGTATLSNVRILDNIADSNGSGVYVRHNGIGSSHLNISDSCIVGNNGRDIYVYYPSGANLENNWWGAYDGPSELGNGYGEAINGYSTTFEPFLTSPPAGCPVLNPVALDDTYSVLSRSSVDITLSAGGGLPPYDYTVVTQPQHGTLSGTEPDLTYAPDNGYLGMDSFTFEVTDANSGISNIATIDILISTDLEATAQTIDVPYETATDFILTATGGTEPYTFTILESPTNGTLSGSAPNLTYTPDAGFAGNDSISFEVTDVDGFTGSALISFNILSELTIDTITHHFVTPGTTSLLFPYIQGGLPPYTVNLTSSDNAEAIYEYGVIYYTMNETYDGIDTLEVEILDSLGGQLLISYTLSSGEPIVFDAIEMQIPYEASTPITLIASGGIPPYTSEVITTPAFGTLIETSELNYDYTPNNGFSGSDYAIVRITDAFGFYVDNYVAVEVMPELIFDDVSVTVNYEQPTQLPIAASGGLSPYTYSIQTAPTNGSLTGTGADLVYTPNTAFSGTDTLELAVMDNLGVVKTASYTITVNTPINISDVSGLSAILQNAYDTEQPVTINLTSSTYTLTQTNNTGSSGENGLPRIRSNVVINGNSATIIRDETSGANFRLFEVETMGLLTIRNLSLEKGEIWNTTYGGGAILNYGQLTVESSSFVNNKTSSNSIGGAITTQNGDMTITDSTFTGNRAGRSGAINVDGNTVISVMITNTVFDSNYAYGSGGAMGISGGNSIVDIIDSSFINNTTQGEVNDNGGALSIGYSTVTINTVNFEDNSGYNGGGIYIGGGSVTINGSSFDGNSGYSADALYIENNSGAYINETIMSNHPGSVINNVSSQAIIANSKFLDNGTGVVARRDVSTPSTQISDSCFVNNGKAAHAAATVSISAYNNWWGAYDGPSGVDSGYGDPVFGNVYFEPFLTTPPNGCLANDPVVPAQTSYVETGQAREVSFIVYGGLPPYTFTNISTPNNGTIIGDASDGVFNYLSDNADVGSDTISFDVTDSLGGTASGVLDIVVRSVLVDEIQTLNIPMDIPTEFALITNSGVLPFTVLSLGTPLHGEVLLSDTNTAYYFPELGFVGTDSFTYQLQDDIGNTATHTVQITLTDRPPATIIVDSTLLENPLTDNGNCTLLEALASARVNVAYDTCAAGSDTQTDIIFVPAGVYQLDRPGDGGDNVIVRGAGIEQTIIERLPEEDTTLFEVSVGHTATYELMTIRNGGGLNNITYDGGAFSNQGILTVNRIAALDNYGRDSGGVVYMPDDNYPQYEDQFIAYNSIFLNNEGGFDRGNVVFGRTDTSSTLINNVFQHTPPGGGVYNDLFAHSITGIHNCFLASQDFEDIVDLRFNWGEGILQLDTPPSICDSIDLLIPVSISGKVTDYQGENLWDILVGFEDAATGTITGVTCTENGAYSFDVTNIEPPRTELIVYAGGADNPSLSCDNYTGGDYQREWFDNVFDAESATIIDLTTVAQVTNVDFQLTKSSDVPKLAAIGDQSLDEGDTLVLNLSASGNDSLTLSFSLNAEAPSFVSLIDNGDDTATLTIAPAFSDSGTYEATISVTDGELSDSETITITVYDFNQIPTADDQNVLTDEDVALDITLTGSDPDGDALIFNVLTMPTNGELSGTFPNLTYTPNANFYGEDSFIFEVCDPESLCDTGTISITVVPVNDDPIAEDDTYEVKNSEKLIVAAPGILSNDTNVEGDTLSAALVDAPTNGNVVLYADGSFSYAPYLDFVGSDTFTYTASNDVFESNVATVTINVLDANVAPVVVDEEYVVNMDGLLSVPAPGVLANDTDANGDSLIPILVTDVSNGQLKLRPDGSLQYTPDIGFSGVDSFTYKVSDGVLESDVLEVIINVTSSSYTPANINLLLNPNFDNGFMNWELIDAQIWSVFDGVTIYRSQRHATAIIYQSLEADIPVGSPIEVHVDLSNNSSETRLIELRITSVSTYDSISCNVLVPPNAPPQTLTMTGITGTDYSGILFEVVAYAPDEVYVTMDNTGLYWRPDETYTTTECLGF